MAVRFLADHCISNFIIHNLREASHEVVRLKDVLPVDSSDELVMAKAQELTAILLSLNGDFADIVTYPPKKYKGIVALQMRNHSEALPHLMRRLSSYLATHSAIEHYHGKLFVVELDRIRIRE
jgi:predicted nuclease of predicted toxin-antitoxin system